MLRVREGLTKETLELRAIKNHGSGSRRALLQYDPFSAWWPVLWQGLQAFDLYVSLSVHNQAFEGHAYAGFRQLLCVHMCAYVCGGQKLTSFVLLRISHIFFLPLETASLIWLRTYQVG